MKTTFEIAYPEFCNLKRAIEGAVGDGNIQTEFHGYGFDAVIKSAENKSPELVLHMGFPMITITVKEPNDSKHT